MSNSTPINRNSHT